MYYCESEWQFQTRISCRSLSWAEIRCAVQATVNGYCCCTPSLSRLAFLGPVVTLLLGAHWDCELHRCRAGDWSQLHPWLTEMLCKVACSRALRSLLVLCGSALGPQDLAYWDKHWAAACGQVFNLSSVLWATVDTTERKSTGLAGCSVHVGQQGMVFEQICVALCVFYDSV